MAVTARIDGRLLRSARTRTAVVDALLDLLNEGELQPTTARIAARAGVSLRVVFHHFNNLEALYSEVALRQGERIRPLAQNISPELPLLERIDLLTAQRSRIYEAISPVRRAGLLMEPFHPSLGRELAAVRNEMRERAASIFAPELNRLADADRPETVAALHAIGSWSAWEQMRRHQGLSEAEARAAMARGFRALLQR